MQLVAMATGVPPEEMAAPSRRGALACRARHVAMYLAHVAFGWPLERVGHAFGRNRSTVGLACRWVEDERERPALDALLDHLEAAIRTAVEAPDARGALGDPA
jgi:chromosomal replication initiation ATPase DnaA